MTARDHARAGIALVTRRSRSVNEPSTSRALITTKRSQYGRVATIERNSARQNATRCHSYTTGYTSGYTSGYTRESGVETRQADPANLTTNLTPIPCVSYLANIAVACKYPQVTPQIELVKFNSDELDNSLFNSITAKFRPSFLPDCTLRREINGYDNEALKANANQVLFVSSQRVRYHFVGALVIRGIDMAEAVTQKIVPLEQETRTHTNTAAAAHHLLRQQQTLRRWASFNDGPICPIRINGKLAWPVAEIKRVLGVAS